MKTPWIFIVAYTLNFIDFTSSWDCKRFPSLSETFVGIHCCQMPQFKDQQFFTIISNQIKEEDRNMLPVVAECKIMEKYFLARKLMKGEKINKEKCLKHIEKVVDDPKWADIMRSGFERCYEEVNEKIIEIEEKYKKGWYDLRVNKTQCNNLKPMALSACIEVEMFRKCPREYLFKERDCQNMVYWLDDCRDDIYSFFDFAYRTTHDN